MTVILLMWPAVTKAQFDQVRPDIDKDIPLSEGVNRYNAQFPDPQPLTEDEVIAAVRRIKAEHPDITDAVYGVYERVVKEKVLPKGMFFSHMSSLNAEDIHYEVDWKDLTLTPIPPDRRDEKIGFGFNYRIRARFISSRPATSPMPKSVRLVPSPDIR